MKYLVLAFMLLSGPLACQVVPTKTSSQTASLLKEKSIESELMLSEGLVILDARSTFDYNLSHIPGSVSVQWQDFSTADKEQVGLLDMDSFSLARRLSLWGIDPDTEVVVVGHALQGAGEEGRIAWMLKYLGVKKIRTLAFNLFKYPIYTAKDEKPPKNKPIWKPEVQTALQVNFEDFLEVLRVEPKILESQKWPTKAKISAMQGRRLPRIQSVSGSQVILDVRSEDEVKGRPFKLIQEGRVQTIFWKNFYRDDGTINLNIKQTLAEKNILPSTQVIVVSNKGVRSAAVAFALLQMDYKNVSNFSSGLDYYFKKQK